MPYWQLFYHLVWATYNRQPLLTVTTEAVIYRIIRSKANGLGGVVFALNGTVDHVHIVSTIPPKIAVATFVGQIKGASSTLFNKEHPQDLPFAWQAEYGAFSFDKKRLPNVVAYVERQKEHHAQGTLIPVLECMQDKESLTHEIPLAYSAEEDAWIEEMLSLGYEL